MRLLTQEELKIYTEAELWNLYRWLLMLLPAARDGSLDHIVILMNLQSIRDMIVVRVRLRPVFGIGRIAASATAIRGGKPKQNGIARGKTYSRWIVRKFITSMIAESGTSPT